MLMIVHNNEEAKSGTMRYRYKGDLDSLSVQDIQSFISDWESNWLEPILKSQPVPTV